MSEKSVRSVNESKSYRVSTFYKICFETVVSIYGKRDPLTDELISLYFKEHFSEHFNIDDLKQLNKTSLAEKMLDELIRYNKSFNELKYIKKSDRITRLESNLKSKYGEIPRVRENIHFRLLPHYQNFITNFAEGTIAEVLELAIANYITNHCSTFEYELINLSFHGHIKRLKKEENKPL
ncbi:hypothetical protein E2L07_19295 [Halalkalibacterium halodurans]|uniref:hypothetical protein n=1 Tax=Halalkalibacterium halodurans TaxID=86665 RepID=UPI0010673E7F|nr:hypothetical protein [Halalkalibacterium halodurans]TES47190.1 hypothetical protein E2L07_19295 [Halalkalibacterium halodurans]